MKLFVFNEAQSLDLETITSMQAYEKPPRLVIYRKTDTVPTMIPYVVYFDTFNQVLATHKEIVEILRGERAS